jgi:CRP-like cAMP-binding protein
VGPAADFGSRQEAHPVKPETFAADRTLIEALEKLSQPVACLEGRTLFIQGEIASGLYILEQGEAALVLKSPAGRAVMCLHAGSGSLLGLPGVVGSAPYTMTAMVSKGSEVGFVTRGDFEKLVNAEPSLYPGVLQVLAAEVRSARLALCDT